MSFIEEMNNNVNNFVDPKKVYENAQQLATDVTRGTVNMTTLEGTLMIEKAGETIANTMDKLGDTANNHFSKFADIIVNATTKIIKESKKPPITGIEPRQFGGTNETDFMKYVYTKKTIWFTKKDMIWN